MRRTCTKIPSSLIGSSSFRSRTPHLEGTRFEGTVTRFSATPANPTHAGPTIGQHTFEGLRDILGYSDEEIVEFAAGGALT